MTALGSHEWFTNAIEGETQIPIGASAGVVSVKVLVVNCVRVSRMLRGGERRPRARNIRGISNLLGRRRT